MLRQQHLKGNLLPLYNQLLLIPRWLLKTFKLHHSHPIKHTKQL